jgi:hypothetical protein
MVAERFVFSRRFIVIWIEKIKNENIDMSSEKRLSDNKLRHLKFKVYKERLILLNVNRSLRQQRKF